MHPHVVWDLLTYARLLFLNMSFETYMARRTPDSSLALISYLGALCQNNVSLDTGFVVLFNNIPQCHKRGPTFDWMCPAFVVPDNCWLPLAFVIKGTMAYTSSRPIQARASVHKLLRLVQNSSLYRYVFHEFRKTLPPTNSIFHDKGNA